MKKKILRLPPLTTASLLLAAIVAVLQTVSVLSHFEPQTGYFAKGEILPTLASVLALLAALVGTLSAFLEKYPKAGVGEIGLDKLKPWDGQEELFKMQLEIAARYNRVVSVHAVKAASEVLYALQEYKNKLPAIIMHAFAGPVHLVPAFKDCGAYFSISPFFLRKKPKIQKQLLSAIPWERLLLETDAPDGAEPDFLPEMIQKIAEIASFAPEELRKITAENAKRLLSHE